MEIQSKNKIVLKLVAGKKWRNDAGFIIAKNVNFAGKAYPLAGLDGKLSLTYRLYILYLCNDIFFHSLNLMCGLCCTICHFCI